MVDSRGVRVHRPWYVDRGTHSAFASPAWAPRQPGEGGQPVGAHFLLTHENIPPQTDGPRHLLPRPMRLWVEPNTSFWQTNQEESPDGLEASSCRHGVYVTRAPELADTIMMSSSPLLSVYGDDMTVFLARIHKNNSSSPRPFAGLS